MSTSDLPTPPDPIASNVAAELLKKEPVIAGYAAAWIVTNVGLFLIGHTHLVDSATWGTMATTLTPVLSGLILGLFSWITRKFVEPVFKKL